MKYTKIIKIEKTESKPIYHLTVDKNHNFFGNNLCLHNCGYRGGVQGTFRKIGADVKKYNVGERAAQLIIMPYPKIFMVESDELSETVRGDRGFGSTGF